MTDLATAPAPTVSTPPLAEAARRDIPAFVRASEQLMLIGGRRVAAASGQTLPSTDPATAQPLARVPRREATDVDAGFLANAGQACVAGSRVFAQASIRDQFVPLLTGAMRATFMPADPFTPGTMVGAFATKAQFDRVSADVDSAREEGAQIVTGGERYGDHGYFDAPTLTDNIRPDMKVVREEIFGPVGVLTTFTDIDDATMKANDTEYGLAASVWTTDLATAHRMAAGIQAGTVWVNTWGEQGNSALPFGGYKQSGIGREGGLDVPDAYTQDKSVLIAF